MSKYTRVINGQTCDVYDILAAFGVHNPAAQHAIKKLLMPGQRGGKGTIQDLHEAVVSVERAMQLAAGPIRGVVDGLLTAKAAAALCQPVHLKAISQHFMEALHAGGRPIEDCIHEALARLREDCLAALRPPPEVAVGPDAPADDQPATVETEETVEPAPEAEPEVVDPGPVSEDDRPHPWNDPVDACPCCDPTPEDEQ